MEPALVPVGDVNIAAFCNLGSCMNCLNCILHIFNSGMGMEQHRIRLGTMYEFQEKEYDIVSGEMLNGISKPRDACDVSSH